MSNFNDLYDVNALKKNLEDINDFSGNVEIPVGKYECKVEKIVLRETKESKAPMCTIQFRIVDGDFKNNCLFYNRVLVGTDKEGKMNVLGLHLNNEFLKTLDSGIEVKFDNFDQYETLLNNIAYEIRNLTYLVEYSKTNNYANYKIKEIYE